MRVPLLTLTAVLFGLLQGTPPAASISGRIRDAYGAALPTGIIAVGTLGYRDGRRTFNAVSAGTTQLDGYGNYRLAPVTPGEYYVRVDGAAVRGLPTYYPGTADIDAATTIAVQAGQEIVGIDFDVASGPTFKVSGTLHNIPVRTLPNGQPDTSILGFTLSSADPRYPDVGAPLLQTTRRTPSEFEISLPPGLWDIFPIVPLRTAVAPAPAIAAATPPIYATGRARVLIKDKDVENVEVTITSARIKGRITVSGSTLNENSGLLATRIGLSARGNYPAPFLTHLRARTVGKAGEFNFDDVPPGKFGFQVSNIPIGFYVSDIRVGSKSIYDDGGLDVGADPIDSLEIVFSRGGGTVRISISGTAAVDRPGYLTAIVLVPSPPRRGNPLLYKTLTYPEAPKYSFFSNVAPGRYKVFAIQNLPPGGAEQSPEFLAKFEDSGVTVDVVDGQSVDVPVQWIPSVKP